MSLIEDFDLIQGDTSKVWFFKHPDTIVMGADWTCKYTISDKMGENVIIIRDIPKNTGGEITVYPNGTRFVFQILESESSQLEVGKKYEVAVQITNHNIEYNVEVAQFKIKIKPQGVL